MKILCRGAFMTYRRVDRWSTQHELYIISAGLLFIALMALFAGLRPASPG